MKIEESLFRFLLTACRASSKTERPGNFGRRIFLLARERLIEQRALSGPDLHTWRPGPNVCLFCFREPIITFATGACTDHHPHFSLPSYPISPSFPSFLTFSESFSFPRKRIRSQRVATFRVRPALFCSRSLIFRFHSHRSLPVFFIHFYYQESTLLTFPLLLEFLRLFDRRVRRLFLAVVVS